MATVGLSVSVPGCQKLQFKWRLNPVWHSYALYLYPWQRGRQRVNRSDV